MTMGNMEDALEELKILKDLAPDEAMVHFLLGKLYKSIKQKGASVRHFTIALNLDPKVCSAILTKKSTINQE
jgi:anaphase-promoting complex subunit 3